MIVLPSSPPLRAWLRSFWLSLGLVATALVALLSLLDRIRSLPWAAALVFLLLPGLLWPQTVIWPYRAWNKLARVYAGFVETVLLRICYFTILVPTSRMGTRLRLERPQPEQSLWQARQSLGVHANKGLHGRSGRTGQGDHWISRYLAWAWSSGQQWRLALLPFLLLLSWLGAEDELALPENLYTLF